MQISKRLFDALRELRAALHAETKNPDYTVMVRVKGGMVFQEQVARDDIPHGCPIPLKGCPECGFGLDDHQAGCSRMGNLK